MELHRLATPGSGQPPSARPALGRARDPAWAQLGPPLRVRAARIGGIELHSGRNRIVRRMFESLGYDVRNLDRVMFGNLTKKNVERGKWRYLVEKEIRLLKFMNSSFIKKTPEDPEEKTLVKRGQAAPEMPEKKEKRDLTTSVQSEKKEKRDLSKPAKPEKKEKRELSTPSKFETKEKRVEIKKPAAARKQTEGRHKPTVQKGGVKRVMRSRTKK